MKIMGNMTVAEGWVSENLLTLIVGTQKAIGSLEKTLTLEGGGVCL